MAWRRVGEVMHAVERLSSSPIQRSRLRMLPSDLSAGQRGLGWWPLHANEFEACAKHTCEPIVQFVNMLTPNST